MCQFPAIICCILKNAKPHLLAICTLRIVTEALNTLFYGTFIFFSLSLHMCRSILPFTYLYYFFRLRSIPLWHACNVLYFLLIVYFTPCHCVKRISLPNTCVYHFPLAMCVCFLLPFAKKKLCILLSKCSVDSATKCIEQICNRNPNTMQRSRKEWHKINIMEINGNAPRPMCIFCAQSYYFRFVFLHALLSSHSLSLSVCVRIFSK